VQQDEAAPARPGAQARARGDVSDALTGRLLDGRYRIGTRIARGGMASVYEAADIRLDRIVAVKIMHEGLGDDAEFAERFVREARSAAQISHPNVVAVFDQGDDQGTLFLAMEYIRGHTLRDVIRDEAPLPPGRALALLEPVVSALAAAHRAGLIHRDVKPENVLIASDGRIKVADFGLAKAVSADTQHTATGGVLIGTVSYLAPELVVDGRADPRADVYAAGVMLYELLTGSKPHEGESPIQVAYKHVHEDVPAPSAKVARLPAYVDALVARATARDRTQRPADAGILLHQLRRVSQALAEGLDDDPELTADLALRAAPSEDDNATTALPVAAGSVGDLATGDAESTAEREAVAGSDEHHAEGVADDSAPGAARSGAAVAGAVAGGAVAGAAAAAAGGGVPPFAHPQLDDVALAAGGSPRGTDQGDPEPSDPFPQRIPADGTSARARRGSLDGATASGDGTGDDVFGLAAAVAGTSQEATTATAERPAVREHSEYTAPIATLGGGAPPHDDEEMAAGPPRRSRRGPLLLLLALLLAVGLGTGAWWFGYGRYTDAPAVLDLAQADAQAKIEDAGLVAEMADQAFSETVAKGKIISADPVAGSRVLKGAVVELTVSLGKERYNVPKLVGRTEDKAQDAIAARHLTFGSSKGAWSETVGEGRVISQSPQAGKRVKPGTVVDLVISKGRKPIRFGDWTGKPVAEAKATLQDRGLKVDDSQTEYSDTVPKGSVISQDPTSGPLYRGDTVTMVVSKGPELVEVPRVIAQGVAAARQTLRDLGFDVRTRKAPNYLGLRYVQSTDPNAGDLVPKGSTITLYLV
jgi:eukaryotic-like serine/threonine-protein kinase